MLEGSDIGGAYVSGISRADLAALLAEDGLAEDGCCLSDQQQGFKGRIKDAVSEQMGVDYSRFCRTGIFPGSQSMPPSAIQCLPEERLRVMRHPYSLSIRLPRREVLDCHSYLTDWDEGWLEAGTSWHTQEEKLLPAYEASLSHKGVLRKAQMAETGGKKPGGRRLEITCGIRRSSPLTKNQIADGVVIYNLHCPSWQGAHYKRKFYPELVAPNLTGADAADPFGWAYKCSQIAHGMVYAAGKSHDFPPAVVEYPFTRLAGRVCNTTPGCLLAKRVMQMDRGKQQLLETLRAKLGESLEPETVWFVLKNADYITPEMLGDDSVVDLLSKIPACLEQGLIIDRLSDFFGKFAQGCKSPRWAFRTVLQMIIDIYSGSDRPWWFKEDIDFTKIFNEGANHTHEKDGRLMVANDIRGKWLASRLANAAGYGFEHTLALYKCIGYRLPQLKGLKEQSCLEFCNAVARDYGIGNTPRAENVIRFAIESLQRLSASEREGALSSFKEYVHRWKPVTEIIGKLEGEDAGVDLPGAAHAVWPHLPRAERDGIGNLTVRVPHLAALEESYNKPPLERAGLLNAAKPGCPLLRAVNHGGSLGVHAGHIDPLRGLFSFYAQMTAECCLLDDALMDLYFDVFAPRMPNPFAPPAGFLKFLQNIKGMSIDDDEIKCAIYPLNTNARSQTQQRVERKYAVAAELVDLWISGGISLEEMFRVLNWLIEGISDKAIAARMEHLRQTEYHVLDGCDEEAVNCLVRGKAEFECREEFRPVMARRCCLLLHGLAASGVRRIFAVNGLADAADSGNLFVGALDAEDDDLAEYRTCPGLDIQQATQEMVESGILNARVVSEVFSKPDSFAAHAGAIRRLARLARSWLDLKEALADDCDDESVPRSKTRAAAVSRALIRNGMVNAASARAYINRVLEAAERRKAVVQAVGDFRSGFELTDGSRLCIDPVAAATRRVTRSVASIVAASAFAPLLSSDRHEIQRVGASSEALTAAVRSGLETAVNPIRRMILRVRKETAGLLPIGGKVHVLHDIDPARFDRLKAVFGLTSTSFQAHGAERSIILPAAPSFREFEEMAAAFARFGVIDNEHPEMQIGGPGRLRPYDAGVLGCAVLLATEHGVQYDEESLRTTHDHDVGRRIMTYDAKGGLTYLPFMPWCLTGRTDMLGRKWGPSGSDAGNYQYLHTVLAHAEFGGPFGHLAEPFREGLRGILGQRRYKLSSVLDEPWIYTLEDRNRHRTPRPTRDPDGREHYLTIKRVTDAYFSCAEAVQRTGRATGIIFEVRALLDWLKAQVGLEQEKLWKSPEACRDIEILLNY